MSRDDRIVIIGAGPVGLATALGLARRGYRRVTVLERRRDATAFEPHKSFNYLVDGRGQALLDEIGLTETLAARGVPNMTFSRVEIGPDGKRSVFRPPFVAERARVAYFTTRSELVTMLQDAVARDAGEAVSLLYDCEVERIDRPEAGPFRLSARIAGAAQTIEADRLIGCDGIHSILRRSLETWEGTAPNRFTPTVKPCPSAGLRYKVMQFPPGFAIDRDGQEPSDNLTAYNFVSALSDKREQLMLPMLPVADPAKPRPGNIIRPADHRIWQVDTAEGVYDFFERAFPQLPVRKLISAEQAEIFATVDGGSFPEPQFCSGMQHVFDADRSALLLGDAVHAFPPDTAQGVNAGLEDARLFLERLDAARGDWAAALPAFETERQPDIAALVEIATFAHPYQYQHDLLRLRMWTARFLLVMLLHRLAPGLFAPPVMRALRRIDVPYRTLLAEERRTRRTLAILLGALGVLALAGLALLIL